MSALDEVSRMQSQGMSSDQIVNQLRAKGVPEQEIVNAMSQSQIKQAVTGGGDQNLLGQGPPMGLDQTNPIPPSQFPGGPQISPQFNGAGGSFGQGPQGGFGEGQFVQQGGFSGPPQAGDSYMGGEFGGPQPGEPYVGQPGGPQGQDMYGAYSAQPAGPYSGLEGSGEYSGMSPSMMSPPSEMGQVGGEYWGGEAAVQGPYGAEAYPMYQPYQEALSSDVITEISEQVVNERLSALQDKIEKIIDMRTIVEANMNNLNDRLKRMEKIIDQMQVSILKKVGEYLTDVQDVKKELEETQKSFVAVQRGKKTKSKKS